MIESNQEKKREKSWLHTSIFTRANKKHLLPVDKRKEEREKEKQNKTRIFIGWITVLAPSLSTIMKDGAILWVNIYTIIREITNWLDRNNFREYYSKHHDNFFATSVKLRTSNIFSHIVIWYFISINLIQNPLDIALHTMQSIYSLVFPSTHSLLYTDKAPYAIELYKIFFFLENK